MGTDSIYIETYKEHGYVSKQRLLLNILDIVVGKPQLLQRIFHDLSYCKN